ncbi:alpha-amylase [Prevotella copri]|uniref:Alpha-amylase n=1 Tax=Segatella copri TaxID=165179 RepID=A0A6A7W9Q8_9BACT|nr:alpha-amylase family glycosyl hydrolase [Segatella copri]MQP11162.1 alpha-amylase [Segatella copri]
MKKVYLTLIALLAVISASAQGWPANYKGVMLQGFSWNAYDYAQWKTLEAQTSELKGFIDLVWVPQSGKCAETVQVMGYKPYYYFNHNSSFGTEDELRSMIKTFKDNGIGTIADVVVNHRNTEGWFTFPAETYKGVTYQMLPTDICKNDDGGKTATQAQKEGVSLSNNNDEGSDFGDCRDLDHKSANVQKVVKAYLKFLKEDLGYIGFRYDMVKGFNASHVGDYNTATGIQYSVGEYWDGVGNIKNWINKTGKKSGAFDFQFHYNMTDAIKYNDWRKLNNSSLMSDPSYRQYAVTFVENHDIQVREDKSNNPDPIPTAYIPAANAFLIAMPGTPCIFQPHWRAYEHELKSMIEARKLVGITNTSSYNNYTNNAQYFANAVSGTNGRKLLVVVGIPSMMATPSKTEYTRILSGKNYMYYLSNNSETAWADKASGEYEEGFKVTLTAVSQNSAAKLVYTTNGIDPTAKSAQVASGTSININSSCTLKVGLLINGTVSGIRTYNYSIKSFEPYNITVYVNTDDTNWKKVNFHIWSSMTDFTEGTEWPGVNITQTKTIDNKNWYYKEFTITQKGGLINFVFCEPNAAGTAAKTQSVDFIGVNSTIFVKVGPNKNSKGQYIVTDVTKDIDTGIDLPITENTGKNVNNAWYTLSGMKMNQKPNQAGIYIHHGKKVVIK